MRHSFRRAKRQSVRRIGAVETLEPRLALASGDPLAASAVGEVPTDDNAAQISSSAGLGGAIARIFLSDKGVGQGARPENPTVRVKAGHWTTLHVWAQVAPGVRLGTISLDLVATTAGLARAIGFQFDDAPDEDGNAHWDATRAHLKSYDNDARVLVSNFMATSVYARGLAMDDRSKANESAYDPGVDAMHLGTIDVLGVQPGQTDLFLHTGGALTVTKRVTCGETIHYGFGDGPADPAYAYFHRTINHHECAVGLHVSTGTLADATLIVEPGESETPIRAADEHYFFTESGEVVIAVDRGVLANDAASDRGPLSARLATPPSHGTVTLNADGSFTYRRETAAAGSDSFSYYATDSSGAIALATVTIDRFVAETTSLNGAVVYEPTSLWLDTPPSIRLYAPVSVPLTFAVEAVGISATPGQDFSYPSEVTLPAGETVLSIPIDVVRDAIREGEETFNLSVRSLTPGLEYATRATVFIAEPGPYVAPPVDESQDDPAAPDIQLPGDARVWPDVALPPEVIAAVDVVPPDVLVAPNVLVPPVDAVVDAVVGDGDAEAIPDGLGPRLLPHYFQPIVIEFIPAAGWLNLGGEHRVAAFHAGQWDVAAVVRFAGVELAMVADAVAPAVPAMVAAPDLVPVDDSVDSLSGMSKSVVGDVSADLVTLENDDLSKSKSATTIPPVVSKPLMAVRRNTAAIDEALAESLAPSRSLTAGVVRASRRAVTAARR